ncbi:MAG: hypothetical protein HY811_02360 [Planctomycetes bacterium]|nr:hypothetical protein [Planctomycetota bacterium]
MNRKIWVFIACTLLFSLNCATHYKLARKHFHAGNDAYDEGRWGKALGEYDAVLNALDEAPPYALHQFMQAAVYHRLYSIGPSVLRRQIEYSVIERLSHIKKLIPEENATDKPDLLALAVRKALDSETASKNNTVPETERWLLIVRDLIMGDIMSYQAGVPDKSEKTGKIISLTSEPFVNNIKQFAFYESAKIFYLEARSKTVKFMKDYPRADISWLVELAKERLDENLWSLASATRALGYMERNEFFRKYFLDKYNQYIETIKYLKTMDAGTESGEKDILGQMQQPNYVIFNGSYHLQEARIKINTAYEEMLTGKTVQMDYFLDAFSHLAFIWVMGDLSALSERQMAESLKDDIYLYLYRISE